MIILGIDPGIERVGVAVLRSDKNKLELLHAGLIKTKKGDAREVRLGEIEKKIAELIKTYRPETLAIEKLFFFKNKKTVMEVAEARGVILSTAGKHNLKVIERTPLEVKKYVCGDGRADKKQVQKMVGLILGLKEIPSSDDTCDAIAIAISAGI